MIEEIALPSDFDGSDGSKKSNHDQNAGRYNAYSVYFRSVAKVGCDILFKRNVINDFRFISLTI